MREDTVFWIASQIQAHHRRCLHDAGGRRQGWRRGPGGESTCRSSPTCGSWRSRTTSIACCGGRPRPSPCATFSPTPAACRSRPRWKARSWTSFLFGSPLAVTRACLGGRTGARWEYSNAGINAVGRIIEVISGEVYEDFLDRRLLQPLGMKDTTFWPNEEQLSRLATSYKPLESGDGLESRRYPATDLPAERPPPPTHAGRRACSRPRRIAFVFAR